MIREFRDFILRGNVIDLAVGIVIGAAFTAVVTSFTGDLLTPLLGLIGLPDFSTASTTVGDAEVRWGLFLNALISFILVAAALFFLVVKPINALERRRQASEPGEPTTKPCPYCATEIPVVATRCPACTSQLEGSAAPG